MGAPGANWYVTARVASITSEYAEAVAAFLREKAQKNQIPPVYVVVLGLHSDLLCAIRSGNAAGRHFMEAYHMALTVLRWEIDSTRGILHGADVWPGERIVSASGTDPSFTTMGGGVRMYQLRPYDSQPCGAIGIAGSSSYQNHMLAASWREYRPDSE